MKRHLVLLIAVVFLQLLPSASRGSVLPSSVSLGLGYTQELGIEKSIAIPSVSVTWHLASHFAIKSNLAYLAERNAASGITARTASGNLRDSFNASSSSTSRSEFFPLAAGLRFYAGQDKDRTRGLFLDATPAIFFSRLPDPSGGILYKAAPGFEVGAGARFSGFDGSRFEIGLNYYHSADFGPHGVRPRLPGEVAGGPSYPGPNLFAAYFAIGFGD